MIRFPKMQCDSAGQQVHVNQNAMRTEYIYFEISTAVFLLTNWEENESKMSSWGDVFLS